MKRAAIPNILSGFRILLVPPAVWLLLVGRYVEATVLIALAVFTDGLDGFLARQFGWRSRIGAILDPVADKILFASVFLTLGYLGHIEPWLMFLVIGRDVLIAGGALLYEKLVGPIVAAPTIISKINTLTLFFFSAALLLRLAGVQWMHQDIIDVLRALVVLTVVSSGLQYVYIWGRKALLSRHSHAS